MKTITKTTKNNLRKGLIWVRANPWWRAALWALAVLVLLSGTMFSISRWYAYTQRNNPETFGVSFIPEYAQFLGLDPQQTMDALIHDVGVRHFRLVSYWNSIEKTPGNYDFSQLDWQFKKAEESHSKVILTVGLRQPRWPECHAPSWIDTTQRTALWQPQLEQYMQTVVDRYKNSPALDRYQLENEYFLKGFGTCNNWSRWRLNEEYKLVKQHDPKHAIIVGRSNNALGFPVGTPTPDEWSISVYKRVWDAGVTHRYLEYPFPSWFYGYIAGVQQMIWHKNMLIAELQAEPWPPHGQTIPESTLNEQNKSFDAQRFEERFAYARGTGMKEAYLWGAEYWYYRKTVLHDDSVWQVAQQEFTK